MEIKKVRELVKLVENSGIQQLEVSHGETTIRIQKCPTARDFALPAAALNGQPVPAMAPVAPASAPSLAPAPGAEAAPAQEPERAKWKEIRSPIVGTFYRASSPDTDPFVKVGDRIAPGQTLCIVEAMKVMNEIEAEIGGTIKEVLAENGLPVEAESILFLVDPD